MTQLKIKEYDNVFPADFDPTIVAIKKAKVIMHNAFKKKKLKKM